MPHSPLSFAAGPCRRRAVTFVGLLLIISLAAGVSSYIDCISVEHWNDLINIGSAAMRVVGEDVENKTDDIESLPHVTAAASLSRAICNLRMDQDDVYVYNPLAPNFLLYGMSYSLSQEYMHDFPDEFVLIKGRWPETETEIAITPHVADLANIGIGALMNYSIELNVGKRPVYVVGIYMQLLTDEFDYYYASIAVVLEELLNPDGIEVEVSVDIDREILDPWNPYDTLNKLEMIERNIAALAPRYPEQGQYSGYHITDDLAIGINSYVEWIEQARLNQLLRSQGVFILAGLFSLLILQNNFEVRRTEFWICYARGASKDKENRNAIGEVMFISLLAVLPSLLIGQFILARFAYSVEGFYRINIARFFQAPVLFTFDTFLFSTTIALFIPLASYGLMKSIEKSTQEIEIEKGRLQRIAKAVRLVRWDVALLVLGGMLLASINLGGVLVRNNPILRITLPLLPAVFIIAVASLAKKALFGFSNFLSGTLARVPTLQSTRIGIRRLARDTKSAVPLIVLFSAALILTISSASVACTMPSSQLKHARFAIGSDIALHLSRSRNSWWANFTEDAARNKHVEAFAQVSVGTMYLSDGRQGGVPFVAATLSDFVSIGYDEAGNSLSTSHIGQLLMELNSTQTGTIITEDIASEYDLKQGDALRSFSLGDFDEMLEFNILAILPVLPAPLIPSASSLDSDDVVGERRVWLNIDHLPSDANLVSSAETYLCLKVEEGENSTAVAEEILSEWDISILELGEWASVDGELDAYLQQESFNMDRAVDTLVSTSSYFFIFMALILHEASQRRSQKREDALIRSMGATRRDMAKLGLAEALGFIVFCLLLVGILCPLVIPTYIQTALNAYPSWHFEFYIQVFPAVPLSLVLALITPAYLLAFGSYAVSAFNNLSKDLSKALSANWAEYPNAEVTV